MAYKFNPITGKLDVTADSKSDVGLSNVDNTSDADKPISTATAAALAGKASTGSATTSGLTMATARLLGRTTAGAGAIEEIQVNGGTFANGTLTLSSLPSSLTADANGNLTFTARWIQSTNGAASDPAHALTGTWFTGGTSTTTKPQLLIEPAGTTSTSWSTAGTGLGINAPSGFTGNMAWIGMNGNPFFIVSHQNVSFQAGCFLGQYIRMANGTAEFGASGITVRDTAYFGSSGSVYGESPDVFLRRDKAGVWAQRNGTNPQAFRVYNTFTSDTNHELAKLSWSSNEFQLGTEKGSAGGTARAMELQTDGTTRIRIGAAGELGFFGAAAVPQPAAVADATDNASAITQLNLALARLRSLGLIAT